MRNLMKELNLLSKIDLFQSLNLRLERMRNYSFKNLKIQKIRGFWASQPFSGKKAWATIGLLIGYHGPLH